MDIEKVVKDYDKNGYAVVENFISESEADEMKTQMHSIVEKMNPNEHPKNVFTTDDAQSRDTYFLESVDKIRFFYEEGAFDKKGELYVRKHLALNKVGHGLHCADPVFKKFSFSSKMKSVIRAIGFKQPAMIQSMYIFKQPKIGGEIHPHYDASFLRAEPIENLMGFWIALDDATLENVERDTYHYARTGNENEPLAFKGPKPNFDQAEYIAEPVKKGACVFIDGMVFHKSAPNKSDKQRHVYTCHMIETKDTKWPKENWLQEIGDYKFPLVFDTE